MSTSPATTAGRRPALLRSIPFWILLVGSLASAIVGIWLILDKISTMTSTLTDGSATGVEVYAGQSWVIVGGVFLAAGLSGLFIVLALAVARSFVPTPAVEAIELIEWNDQDDAADTASVLGSTAAPTAAPAAAATAEPAAPAAPEAPVEAEATVEAPTTTPTR